MIRKAVCIHLFPVCVCVAMSMTAGAADLVQTHDPLALNVGLGGWGFDTGWMGTSLGFGGVYIQLFGNVGGTALDVSLNGQGKLAYPAGVGLGGLSFQGATDGGVVSQDLGIELGGKYRIVIGSTPYEGDLPVVPNTDIRLADTKTVTPYQLGSSVTLSDSIDNQNLYTYNIGVKNLFSADIGVGISGSDSIQVNFKSLNTDKATFTADGQTNEIPVTDSTLAVGGINETLGVVPTMTLTPNVIVGITVAFIPYHIIIPTFPITVPLSSLLQPEYPTTPDRSITFQIPPDVLLMNIGNGAPYTPLPAVTLNNSCGNAPTEYMASERPDFSDAVWQPYSLAPLFVLSAGDGIKTVYFKTRNGAGESAPVADTILLDTTPPTGAIVINDNRSVTNSPGVTLALTWNDGAGSGTARMRFSNDGATWTAWEPLAATRAYTLPAGEGYKTVRVQFLDRTNIKSAVYSDYIRVDTIPPTGSIVINNGASSTKTPSVTLGLTWSDGTGSGVSRMRFSDNGATWTPWEALKATRAYTLPAGAGYHTVRVQYLDGGSNHSPVYNDYIKLLTP